MASILGAFNYYELQLVLDSSPKLRDQSLGPRARGRVDPVVSREAAEMMPIDPEATRQAMLRIGQWSDAQLDTFLARQNIPADVRSDMALFVNTGVELAGNPSAWAGYVAAINQAWGATPTGRVTGGSS